MLVGIFYIFLRKNREKKQEAIVAAAPQTPQERVQELISKINTAGETYEIKQRRQVTLSRTAKRVMEISYAPVDNVQLMHDLNTIVIAVNKTKNCIEQTIFETLNTIIFGQPTHDEVEILEMIAAKAYLKSKGRALILGFDYDDICNPNAPPLSVPTGYRELVASEL